MTEPQRLVFEHLLQNVIGMTGKCIASISKISRSTRLGYKSIQEAIEWLASNGWIIQVNDQNIKKTYIINLDKFVSGLR
jgi:predicted transcriptional regulator